MNEQWHAVFVAHKERQMLLAKAARNQRRDSNTTETTTNWTSGGPWGDFWNSRINYYTALRKDIAQNEGRLWQTTTSSGDEFMRESAA